MHPLYPLNDAPPCTPLPIVNRISATKPHKSRLLGIAKGGCKCTPSVEILHTLARKTGHENLKLGHGKLDIGLVRCYARFTVTHACGSYIPELPIAVRTRSFDSITNVLGSPSRSKPSRPSNTFTSKLIPRIVTP